MTPQQSTRKTAKRPIADATGAIEETHRAMLHLKAGNATTVFSDRTLKNRKGLILVLSRWGGRVDQGRC